MNSMNAFFVGLQSPAEVAVAWKAVEQYRLAAEAPQSANPNSTVPLLQTDAATAAVAERIYKGLARAPLGPRYTKMLTTWYDAPAGQAVTIDDLGKTVGANHYELRASLAKLSGRMKRIATPEEAAAFRTPFLLLADIEYDERNSSQHRLTPAGREAVRKYLNL
jgi:hypothetical protein